MGLKQLSVLQLSGVLLSEGQLLAIYVELLTFTLELLFELLHHQTFYQGKVVVYHVLNFADSFVQQELVVKNLSWGYFV